MTREKQQQQQQQESQSLNKKLGRGYDRSSKSKYA